jgi:hypothetical protein
MSPSFLSGHFVDTGRLAKEAAVRWPFGMAGNQYVSRFSL